MDITLARILKIKKILVGKLAKVQLEISTYNSVISGTEQPDVRSLVDQRERLVEFLLVLKNKQATANQGIQRTLFELAEIKSSLIFWGNINTMNGDSGTVHYGSPTKIVYTAEIKKDEKEKKVASLEAVIEELQERIDQYNYTTKIAISDELLQAIGVRR